MSPAERAPSSSLMQILQATVGDEALDITSKAMKKLSKPENFRYSPASDRLEVLVPLADEELWVRRKTVKTLMGYINADDQDALSQTPGANNEEYTFWLAQCVHYGLNFPSTTEDAKRLVRMAVEQGLKKEPPHLRILSKRLKREYIERYGESDDEEEQDEGERNYDEEEEVQVPTIVPEEAQSEYDMVDNDCYDDWQLAPGGPGDEDSDAALTEEAYNADDDDDNLDELDNNKDKELINGKDNSHDGDDGNFRKDEGQEARGVSEESIPAINMNNDDEDGVYDLGDEISMPGYRPSDSPKHQPATKSQKVLPRRSASAIEVVDLSQQSPPPIYDLRSDRDSESGNPSLHAEKAIAEEASYDAALRDHLEFFYNEDEYDQLSEYDAGSVATETNDQRSSSRVTRSSAAKHKSKTSAGHVEAPFSSLVCLSDSYSDLDAVESGQERKGKNKAKQKDTPPRDGLSQDLPSVEDLLPSATHVVKSSRLKTRKKTVSAPESKSYMVEDRPSSQLTCGNTYILLHNPKARSPASVLDSTEGHLPDPDMPQAPRPLKGTKPGKDNLSDKESIHVSVPPSEIALTSSNSEDGLMPPLTMRSHSGKVVSVVDEPRKHKPWSLPCRSKLEPVSGAAAQPLILTPSPRESRFLRQSTFQKKKGAVLQGKHGASMMDSFSRVTGQSTLLSTPFARHTHFPIQSFANQMAQRPFTFAARNSAEQAGEQQIIVDWHREEYQKLREVKHQNFRKGQPEAEVAFGSEGTQGPISIGGKEKIKDDNSSRSADKHGKTNDFHSNVQPSTRNGDSHPRKKPRLATPSKIVDQSKGRGKTSSSHTGGKTPMRKKTPVSDRIAKHSSDGEGFGKKEGSRKTPAKHKAATRTSKKEKTENDKSKKKSRAGQTPTKTKARLDRQESRPDDTAAKCDKNKKSPLSHEHRSSQSKSSKQAHGWESITYTSNPMAGRRPGSYRLDNLEPQHFREIVTIVNPVARPGQSLKGLPPPRQIPTPDHGSEPPLELQWVAQRRAFKKRKLDEFMASLPEDSTLKDRLPVIVGETRGLRFEYV